MRLLVLLLAILISLPAAQAQTEACTKLNGLRVEAAQIALPTKGAIVRGTRWIEARAPTGGYCLVSGSILSVDPAAQAINFQLALPDAWNGKAAMIGGGGFNGVIPDVAGNLRNMPADSLTPLARGYAVFAGDSGHQAPASATPPFAPDSGAFLANDEQYRNYIGDALKKTRDVAVALIRTAKGRAPQTSYFFGSSKGGTEALFLVDRWPADWDGVVALYPGRSFALALLGQLHVTQAFAAPGAYLTMGKRRVLHEAALYACDALDGARDRIISDIAGCYAVFDPAKARVGGSPLRCPGGGDAGETCLSDVQIAALRKAGGPVRFGFPVAGSEKEFLGFNILTADLGNSGDPVLGAAFAARTIGTTQATFPPSGGNSASAFFSDRFLRGGVVGDPGFDQLAFDIANPGGALADRLGALVAMDGIGANLASFHARKGKLVILHGTDDMLSSPRQIESYYREMQAVMGRARVEQFVRFYEVPGFGHNGGAVFNAVWDQMTALEAWAERGVDPADDQVVADITGIPGRTRPLCRFPAWPKYNGSGSLDAASSFVCAAR